MKNYLLPLLFLSTIVYAADEKEQEISPLRYTMEYDNYRNLIIGTKILDMGNSDHYAWIIRDLNDGKILTQGRICPKDDPRNSILYTPSEETVRILTKKIDAHEVKLAIAKSDEVEGGLNETNVYYECFPGYVMAQKIFKTPRYVRYITGTQELSKQDMKVSGSITFLDNLKTVFFEPSEQTHGSIKRMIELFLDTCEITRDENGKVEMVITKNLYRENDLIISELVHHRPGTLSIGERHIHNLKTQSRCVEGRIHYEEGPSDYVVYTPWDAAKKIFEGKELERRVKLDMNMINGSSENYLYYDRWLNAVVMTVKFATSEHIRFLKGVQKMDKHSDMETSGFLYLFRKMRTVPCGLSDKENGMLKDSISDFLKKCTITYDDQGKLKKLRRDHVGSQEGQIIAERVEYRPGACAIRSKLIKDVDANTCTISGKADLFDDIFTVAYAPSEKEVSALTAKMKKYVTEKNEPQIKAIERTCQVYLDDYMKEVVQMSQVVECGDDGYAVVESGDDSYVDLNSDEEKDGSIGFVLSLLEKYIALKNETIVKF